MKEFKLNDKVHDKSYGDGYVCELLNSKKAYPVIVSFEHVSENQSYSLDGRWSVSAKRTLKHRK
jgi:hypothetical protein